MPVERVHSWGLPDLAKMENNRARENGRYYPNQTAEDFLNVAAESDKDTEVGSIIFTTATTEVGDSIADLSNGARADTEGKRFTSNDKRTMTEADIVAMVRLKCSFMALDNIIELYDSFDSRFGNSSNHLNLHATCWRTTKRMISWAGTKLNTSIFGKSPRLYGRLGRFSNWFMRMIYNAKSPNRVMFWHAYHIW